MSPHQGAVVSDERGDDLDSLDSSIGDYHHTAPSSHAASSPRHVNRQSLHHQHSTTAANTTSSGSGTSSAIASLTSQSTLDTLSTRLDLSPTERDARKGLLRDTFFDHFRDDSASSVAARSELETPEEMQKNDPLGTQIWKLYHKTKGQLPNSERLENLSWRMMSMNLRRKELERQGYVHAQQCFMLDSRTVC